MNVSSFGLASQGTLEKLLGCDVLAAVQFNYASIVK